jgi:hypothetical protein
VVADTVRKGSIDVYLNALGTVTPSNMVTVRSRVDGQLLRVGFQEGQMVKAGDVLAEIDPRPFQVQLAQANGQMAKDVALLKNAQVDLQRYQTLLAQDSIAKQPGRHAGIAGPSISGRDSGGSGPDRQCEVAAHLLARYRTYFGPRRTAPGRSRQYRSRIRCERAGADCARSSPAPWCSLFPRTMCRE